MFRFSVRDLFWLTLVVALALAWWLDRQQVRAEVDQVRASGDARAKKWRGRTGALENALTSDGWQVTWETAKVWLTKTPGNLGTGYYTDTFEPTIQDN
jgi:hypothetical protein